MSKSNARRLLPGLAAAALGLALLAGPAGTPSLAETAPLAKADVEKIVRDYLLENPEVIREALEELERRDIAKADEARAQTLSSVSDILFNSTRQVELGNPDGDVTLVEFFDYNCGYCKRAMADMDRLLKEDPNLRVVLKEFPVLGQGSVEAAQVAAALNHIAPAKYAEFHRELMGIPGPGQQGERAGRSEDGRRHRGGNPQGRRRSRGQCSHRGGLYAGQQARPYRHSLLCGWR